MDVKQIAEEYFESVVSIRRHLHQNPELGFDEVQTAELICSELEKMGIPYQNHVAETGVVGLIEVPGATKTLLIRADMDALPMQEENDCDFKSKRDGVMHACGHDAHMAIVLGTAMILKRMQSFLACNIKLIFQPAEEVEGGAEPMIRAGILENPHVDAAVGGHVMNSVPAGKVLIKYGEMMAAPDDFKLIVHGKGGHGAYPHQCINPIMVAAEIMKGWDALSAHCITPLEKHLISVTIFKAGTCFNIIPDSAELGGTVRVFNETVRRELADRMKEIAEKIGEAYGAQCDFHYTFRYPPLVNDKGMTDAFRASAERILGAENVVEGTEPSMAGEDFAYFGHYVPSCFINYGMGNPAIGAVQPLHSSNFTIDENGLKTGMIALSQFALDYGRM